MSFPVREERRGADSVQRFTPSKRSAPEGGRGSGYDESAQDGADGLGFRLGKVQLGAPEYDEPIVRGSTDETVEEMVSDHRRNTALQTNILSAEIRKRAIPPERVRAYFRAGAVPLVLDRQYLVDRAVRLLNERVAMRGLTTEEYERKIEKLRSDHKMTVACIIAYRDELTKYGIPVDVQRG